MDTPDEFSDLLDLNPHVRLQAAERAIEKLSHDPEALMARLEPCLEDLYPKVRHRAALGLGEVAARNDQTLLFLVQKAALLEDMKRADWFRQQAALAGLGRAGRMVPRCEGSAWDQARTTSLSILKTDNADSRFQALAALQRLDARGEELETALLPLLADPDPEVRTLSAEVLAEQACTRAIPAIVDARSRARLEEERRKLTVALARLLALQGEEADPTLLAEIVGVLVKEAPKIPFGLEASALLGRLGASQAIPALQKISRSWLAHRLVKVAAAAALASLGDAEGVEKLRKSFKARKRDARGFAMERAGELRLAMFRTDLQKIAKDPSDYHADTAVLALALMGDEESLKTVVEAARDDRPEVRLEAARALWRLRIAPEALQRLQDDPSEEVRKMATGIDPASAALY